MKICIGRADDAGAWETLDLDRRVHGGHFLRPESIGKLVVVREVRTGVAHQRIFGFYAFSKKPTVFIDPFMFGVLTGWFGSQRISISIVLVSFLIGGLFLYSIDEEECIQSSEQSYREIL